MKEVTIVCDGSITRQRQRKSAGGGGRGFGLQRFLAGVWRIFGRGDESASRNCGGGNRFEAIERALQSACSERFALCRANNVRKFSQEIQSRMVGKIGQSRIKARDNLGMGERTRRTRTFRKSLTHWRVKPPNSAELTK